MKGRAKRKMITTKMTLCPVDIATEHREFDWEKKYWDTFHCQNMVYTADGRLYGRYCKNRFCLLCCSIRKADIMDRYLPFLSACKDLYFVTLTAKTVPLQSLRKRMLSMINGFGIILAKHKKRAQRSKGVKPVGIRSLEPTAHIPESAALSN